MIKRIIDISQSAYIHIESKQLLIEKEQKTVARIPVEDIGVIILQNPSIVFTQAAIIACQKNNVVIVFCDERHLPYSVILPVSEGHTLHHKELHMQLGATKPKQKRLWQQIVKQKILNQSVTLRAAGCDYGHLKAVSARVKSGDPDNVEAQAAKYYWQQLFGKEFRRDVNADGLNGLLNYGYSIIRAMVARAIVGGGLHPALGLHHHNQYNGLCLADDLMEPLRPWVDWLVYRLSECGLNTELDKHAKSIILGILSIPVKWEDRTMPLMVASHHYISSLKKSLASQTSMINFPVWELATNT